jgi:hypothetical protein
MLLVVLVRLVVVLLLVGLVVLQSAWHRHSALAASHLSHLNVNFNIPTSSSTRSWWAWDSVPIRPTMLFFLCRTQKHNARKGVIA